MCFIRAPQSELSYQQAWARTILKAAGAVDNQRGRGIWALTEAGRALTEAEIPSVLARGRAVLRSRTAGSPGRPPDLNDVDLRPLPLSEDWRDRLLRFLAGMSAPAFERLCQRLLRESGFISVQITGRSGDGGIDGIGVLRINLLSFPVLFQCKRYTGGVGASIVRDFRGAMVGRTDKGLLIATGSFTADARREATRDGAPPLEDALEQPLDALGLSPYSRIDDQVIGGRLLDAPLGGLAPSRVCASPNAQRRGSNASCWTCTETTLSPDRRYLPPSGRIDLPGAVTATAGMLALVYGVSQASTHGWGSPGTIVPLGAAVFLLVSFGIIESQRANPLVPLRIFANRNRSGSYGMMLCLGTAVFSMFFFMTQFLQNVLGWSPVQTGVGFLPFTAGIVTSANVASRLVGRIGIRVPLLVGPGARCIGLLWLSRLTVTSGYSDMLGPLLLIAVGTGLEFVPLTLTAVRGVRPDETGLASALLNTAQQAGGALGLSMLATVAITATRSTRQSLSASATAHGYTTAFAVAAGIALVGFMLSLIVLRAPRPAISAACTVCVEEVGGAAA